MTPAITHTKAGERAMTLLEIMIASTILGGAMLVVMTLLVNFTNSTTDQHYATITLQRGSRAIDAISDPLRYARVNEDASDPQLLVFQKPIVVGENSVDWGVRFVFVDSEAGPDLKTVSGGSAVYRFVVGTDPISGASMLFDEAAEGYDLNGDGAMSAVFEIGHIEVQYYSGEDGSGNLEKTERLTGDVVVQLQGAPEADFVGDDGVNETIFSDLDVVDAAVTALTVTLVVTDPEVDSPELVRLSTRVVLKNSL